MFSILPSSYRKTLRALQARLFDMPSATHCKTAPRTKKQENTIPPPFCKKEWTVAFYVSSPPPCDQEDSSLATRLTNACTYYLSSVSTMTLTSPSKGETCVMTMPLSDFTRLQSRVVAQYGALYLAHCLYSREAADEHDTLDDAQAQIIEDELLAILDPLDRRAVQCVALPSPNDGNLLHTWDHADLRHMRTILHKTWRKEQHSPTTGALLEALLVGVVCQALDQSSSITIRMLQHGTTSLSKTWLRRLFA